MIWASRYKQQIHEELLKALVARWSPCTNNILTCYGELGIFLWDVYRSTRLSIVGEMYDELFFTNKLTFDEKLPVSVQRRFAFGHIYLLGHIDPDLLNG